jgi:hypothetical protein
MINKVTWYGCYEEFPINMWEVEVTDWVIGKIVFFRKVFFKTCHGFDARTAKPHTEWCVTSAGIEEKGTFGCPKGCLWVDERRERLV